MERAIKQQKLQQLELELNAKLEHYTTVDTSTQDHFNTGKYHIQFLANSCILEALGTIIFLKDVK